MATWAEIQRLAADLQVAQAGDAVQRLSERDCVDVVRKLQRLNLIEVTHTLDGREYVTPEKMCSEILDELSKAGGRLNIVELQQRLSIDFSHIEARVHQLVKHDPTLQLFLGQLINSQYVDTITDAMEEKLQSTGSLSLGSIAVDHDLPTQFIQQVVDDNLGKRIHGRRDPSNPSLLFTDLLLCNYKNQIRLQLHDVSRPTNLSGVRTKANSIVAGAAELPDSVFNAVMGELMSAAEIVGVITGFTFVPKTFTDAQISWLNSFFSENNFIDYSQATSQGISDIRDFIKRHLSTPVSQLVFLDECVVSVEVRKRLVSLVDECIKSEHWADASCYLPSALPSADVGSLLERTVLPHDDKILLLCETLLVSRAWIAARIAPFEAIMKERSTMDVKSLRAELSAAIDGRREGTGGGGGGALAADGSNLESKRDARRKRAAVGKAGGGTQGRESKTKGSRKKVYGKQDKSAAGDSDDDREPNVTGSQLGVVFMQVDQIESALREHLRDEQVSDELSAEVAAQLFKPLNRKYEEVLRSVFIDTQHQQKQAKSSAPSSEPSESENGPRTEAGGSSRTKRLSAIELQSKMNERVTLISILSRHINDLFSEEDHRIAAERHLLRSACLDAVLLALTSLAAEQLIQVPSDDLLLSSHEERVKLSSSLPQPHRAALTKLNAAANGKDLSTFLDELETVCGPEHLGILLRSADKKTERSVTHAWRCRLREKCTAESDAATTLQLAAQMLVYPHSGVTGAAHVCIELPGRLVPVALQKVVDPALCRLQQGDADVRATASELQSVLPQFQDLIVEKVKAQQSDPEGARVSEVAAELKNMQPRLKQLVSSLHALPPSKSAKTAD